MKKLKNIFIIAIIASIGISLDASAYEWNQLTEAGIINKTAISKSQKSDKELLFSDLEIKKKILTKDEMYKTFPALSSPKTIVVMGDTGCRLKESKLGAGEYQDCNDNKAWPFWKIAEEAGKENPDLIIHLGDYHYRENCSAGKSCEKMSPFVGYGWKPWELDFFQPMQKLLKKAPIIIVRGNHEDCNRSYLGYQSLLANSDWEQTCLVYEPVQIITLGDTAIINLDSSSIPEIPTSIDEEIWIKRFNDINDKIVKLKIKNVWLMTHKPIYGVIPFKFALIPGNLNLRRYFEKSLLKDKISVIFGGHIHTSMIVIPQKFPKQIVLGNSGTQLENFRAKITKSSLNAFSYESANLVTHGFGYAILKKTNTHSWTIIFKDSNGKELLKDKL